MGRRADLRPSTVGPPRAPPIFAHPQHVVLEINAPGKDEMKDFWGWNSRRGDLVTWINYLRSAWWCQVFFSPNGCKQSGSGWCGLPKCATSRGTEAEKGHRIKVSPDEENAKT